MDQLFKQTRKLGGLKNEQNQEQSGEQTGEKKPFNLIDFYKNQKKETTEEVSYYICNSILEAKTYCTAIREHWGIENKVHYVKDKSMQEDILVKREKPLIFSFMIDFALNIMRFIDVKNIRQFMYQTSLDCKKNFGIDFRCCALTSRKMP